MQIRVYLRRKKEEGTKKSNCPEKIVCLAEWRRLICHGLIVGKYAYTHRAIKT